MNEKLYNTSADYDRLIYLMLAEEEVVCLLPCDGGQVPVIARWSQSAGAYVVSSHAWIFYLTFDSDDFLKWCKSNSLQMISNVNVYL